MNLDDTIVAIATAPGRGGIGVVRIAGARAREIATPILRLRHELEPGRAVFGELVEPCGQAAELRSAGQPGAAVPTRTTRIDEVVVTYFAKPHSYTTDDIVEISAHGSPVVLRRMVELCVAAGARLAEPGEFTMRAFLNGRIDLTQAEAVRDLIDSRTLYQAKVAAQQLGGALSKRLQPTSFCLIGCSKPGLISPRTMCRYCLTRSFWITSVRWAHLWNNFGPASPTAKSSTKD